MWIYETDFSLGFVFSKSLRTGILHLSENPLFITRVIDMHLIGYSSVYSMWGFFWHLQWVKPWSLFFLSPLAHLKFVVLSLLFTVGHQCCIGIWHICCYETWTKETKTARIWWFMFQQCFWFFWSFGIITLFKYPWL